jgi:hypothetical protein
MDIIASKQFGSLESLLQHVLREFEWLAPAVLRVSAEHNLPGIPALQPAFALVEAMGVAPEPEPEPEVMEPEPEPTLAPTGPLSRLFPVKAPEDRQYDVFINHCQASGQDQCGNLAKLLQSAGCKVWYDMQAQDLTAEGMEEGVSQSRCVLMFLSDDLMGRPFCHAEQRWGQLYGCNFVGVVEKDSRHGAADFATEKERAPADLKHLLDEVEFIEYRRRDFEAKAMVEELVRRVDPFGQGALPLLPLAAQSQQASGAKPGHEAQPVASARAGATVVRIFGSMRFGSEHGVVPMAEQLRDSLAERGVSLEIINMAAGGDIDRQVFQTI